mmetsp:Transcript_126519/g.369683  ORF Transcript_126519/g.369683 Transcript_126519/m.369683 type:complete len:682 (-) Transcript_126519:35-2080(-)
MEAGHSEPLILPAPRSSALLRSGTERLVERSQHAAAGAEQGETLFATALKVITCGLGSGILVVPWGAAGASLAVSHAITGLVLLANIWSVMIIVHAIDRWGGSKAWNYKHGQWLGTSRKKGYRVDDLGMLLRQAPPPLPALAAVWDVTVNISNFGALVGYMIVTGDAMTPLVSSGCQDMADRRAWILLGSLVCLPLCWADLAFLTYSSAVGVCANVYLFFVLLFALRSRGVAEGVCTVGIAPGALACMSNLVFAVVLQMCIPEYYTQLRRDDQDPGRFLRWVLIPAFSFIFVLVCAFSTVGYLTFGPSVSSNVLLDLAPDAWGRSTQAAICLACLMVYPNMLRPMVPPLLRAAQWLCSPAQSEPEADDRLPDIYEGRLVHTELMRPAELDHYTGTTTLQVYDTCGFQKDALVFLDGRTREYAIIQEVLLDPFETSGSSSPLSAVPERSGCLRLRPRFGVHAKEPVLDAGGSPTCALSNLLPVGTKVVLDEDPVLVTAAVAGERCLHVSFLVGISRGALIVVGEGARAEKLRVARTRALEPERASVDARIRTHDLVLYLERGLKYNHGAHTRVVLDHGPTEAVATVIVLGVMAVTFVVRDLGFVNVANGAISVAVIVGAVPGACAWCLHEHWEDGKRRPLSIRYRAASVCFALACVVIGSVGGFFTENRPGELAASCGALAK